MAAVAVPIVATEHKATVSGARLVEVDCEECSTRYGYVMERRATASSATLYWIGDTKTRAEYKARAALERKLDEDRDIVPCPQCAWVQSDMVQWARRNRLLWLRVVGIVLTTVPVILAALMFLLERPALVWSHLLPIAAAGVGLIVLQLILATSHDPNARTRESLLSLSARHALPAGSLDEVREELREQEKDARRAGRGLRPRG